MPTRWRWPPDSASARRVACSGRPTASSSAKARTMSGCRVAAQPGAPERHVAEPARTARSPSPTAARPGCIPGTPCRCVAAPGAARVPRSSVRSCAVQQDLAALGSTRRLMQRISVDLPVPEGPMTAVIPSGAMDRSMPRSTGLPGAYSLHRPRITRPRGPPCVGAWFIAEPSPPVRRCGGIAAGAAALRRCSASSSRRLSASKAARL